MYKLVCKCMAMAISDFRVNCINFNYSTTLKYQLHKSSSKKQMKGWLDKVLNHLFNS